MQRVIQKNQEPLFNSTADIHSSRTYRRNNAPRRIRRHPLRQPGVWCVGQHLQHCPALPDDQPALQPYLRRRLAQLPKSCRLRKGRPYQRWPPTRYSISSVCLSSLHFPFFLYLKHMQRPKCRIDIRQPRPPEPAIAAPSASIGRRREVLSEIVGYRSQLLSLPVNLTKTVNRAAAAGVSIVEKPLLGSRLLDSIREAFEGTSN